MKDCPRRTLRSLPVFQTSRVLIRALTAVVLIIGFIGVLSAETSTPLRIAMTAVVAGGAYEWARLSKLVSWRAAVVAALFAGSFAIAIRFVAPHEPTPVVLVALVTGSAFWLLVAPFALVKGVAPLERYLLVSAIPAILPAGIASIYLGPKMFLVTIAIAWVADTFAYLGGRAFGRRKLAPSISPGKTWEGAWCGMVAVLVYAWACAVFGYSGFNAPGDAWAWLLYLGAAVVLTCISVVGDLFESALKRHAGVKDSGKLLPGHGGILDRVDSALALLPVAALMLLVTRQLA